jgi:Glycosyltransferase sugar-binding region containing DXD motif
MRGPPPFVLLCGLLLAAVITCQHLLLLSSFLTRSSFSFSSADERRQQQQHHDEAEGEGEGEGAPLLLLLLLRELTRSSSAECPTASLAYVSNKEESAEKKEEEEEEEDAPSTTGTAPLPTTTTIPPVLHQTSRSRCVTPEIANATARWKDYGEFAYYLHDDDAVHRLFRGHYDEFPLLRQVVEAGCLASGAILSDLWRYVALYKYGGIYVDIDSVPGPAFDPRVLLADGVDALFVVDRDGLLSQYFMALAPRHPLLWYAVHETLGSLWRAKDTGSVYAPDASGPLALHRAFLRFLGDGVGVGQNHTVPEAVIGRHGVNTNRPVSEGTYVGTHNRTVRALGSFRNADAFVRRQIFDRWTKYAQYSKMDMKHFSAVQKVASRRSCMRSALDAEREEKERRRHEEIATTTTTTTTTTAAEAAAASP